MRSPRNGSQVFGAPDSTHGRALGLFVLISCPFSSFATAAERASAARDVLMSDGAERLSKDWKQCRSSDLEVVSNASAGQMKEVVATLSAFRAALAEKFPTLRFTSPVPTVVVLFKNDAAFTPYKPRDGDGRIRSNVAGYFYAGASRNYIVLPAVGQGSLPSLQVILHEYVHSVLSRNSVEWPLWLEEGLADLYSTFEYDAVKGLGTVGIAPAQRIDTLRRFPPFADRSAARRGTPRRCPEVRRTVPSRTARCGRWFITSCWDVRRDATTRFRTTWRRSPRARRSSRPSHRHSTRTSRHSQRNSRSTSLNRHCPAST